MNDLDDQDLELEEDVEIDDDSDDQDDTHVGGYEKLASEEIPEEEGDTTPEPEPEPEPEPQHKPSHDNVVPQARFNQVRLESKQKDEMIAELQRQLQEQQAKVAEENKPKVVLSDELKDLYKQLKEAHFEDDDSALEIQEKIRQINLAEAEEIFERKMQQYTQHVKQQEQLSALEIDRNNINETLAQWISDHPELDQDSESFDVELWNDTMAYQETLTKRYAISGNEALIKALNKMVGAGNIKAPKPEPEAQKTVVDKRTERSVTRGIEKSKSTPPNINQSTSGNRSKSLEYDIEKMSEAEFNKLPKEVIDRLKGKK